MYGQIIGAVVVLFIGFTLLPEVQEQVKQVSIVQNVSSPFSESFLTMIPIVFSLAILMITITMGVSALRSAGLIGGNNYHNEDDEEEEEDTEEKTIKPHKQTYKEFVKERLQVESMLNYNPLRRWFG